MRKACDWFVELFNKYLTKATKYNITYDNIVKQAAALTEHNFSQAMFYNGL